MNWRLCESSGIDECVDGDGDADDHHMMMIFRDSFLPYAI